MKKILSLVLCTIMIAGCLVGMTSCGNKVKIGVQSGTTGELYLKGNADMLFEGYDNIKCMPYDAGGLAVKAMIDKQIDYVIIDNEPAKQLVNQNPEIKMIDIALSAEEYAFGVDKNQAELLASVNQILAEIKADGTLDAIFEKYSGLTYDEDGNVTGGDENIEGITSATKNNDNPAGQLVVATNAAFAPYEYKKGDKFVGIDMDIAKIIADRLDLELVIENMDFEAVVTSVGKNNIDIAMAGLSVTATRKQSVNFSDVYYSGAYQVILVLKENTEFDNCKTKADIEAILKTK